MNGNLPLVSQLLPTSIHRPRPAAPRRRKTALLGTAELIMWLVWNAAASNQSCS